MADDRKYTAEALETGRWAVIAALSASGGSMGKAINLIPDFALALAEGSREIDIAAGVLDAKVFKFVLDSYEIEESSTRMVLTGHSPTGDKEEEKIRSYRTDSARGREQEKVVKAAVGKMCLVRVYVDVISASKKVRVLEHLTVLGDPDEKPATVRPDSGPAPESRPKAQREGKVAVQAWQAMFAVLSLDRQAKIAAWFPGDIDNPPESELQLGSKLMGVYNRALDDQEKEATR